MAWTKTLLASLLASIAMSMISIASAFSGNFEISDLYVDSPFQMDVTSTANSTVTCKSHTVSVIEAHSLYCTVSLNETSPGSSASYLQLLHCNYIALTDSASAQLSSSMKTLRKSIPSHAAPHGQSVSLHRPNPFQAYVQTTQCTSHSHQAPTTELRACTFRYLTRTRMIG